MGDDYFGEGLTLFNDKFYQLTWKARKCFVYDRNFKKVGEFDYKGEGWGLTHDGRHLIMSNGTPTLTFRDPDTFEIIRKITVRYGRTPQQSINELEYVDKHIFANVLNKNYLLKIDPNTGETKSEIDLRDLVPKDKKVDVLNGIAHNTTTGYLMVTGKKWPKIYEIERVPIDSGK